MARQADADGTEDRLRPAPDVARRARQADRSRREGRRHTRRCRPEPHRHRVDRSPVRTDTGRRAARCRLRRRKLILQTRTPRPRAGRTEDRRGGDHLARLHRLAVQHPRGRCLAHAAAAWPRLPVLGWTGRALPAPRQDRAGTRPAPRQRSHAAPTERAGAPPRQAGRQARQPRSVRCIKLVLQHAQEGRRRGRARGGSRHAAARQEERCRNRRRPQGPPPRWRSTGALPALVRGQGTDRRSL